MGCSLKFLLSFLLFASNHLAQAKILVYEYGFEGYGNNHGLLVTQIACRDLKTKCETFYSKHLNQEDLLKIANDLSPGDVVNMSFVCQKPQQVPNIHSRHLGQEDLFKIANDLDPEDAINMSPSFQEPFSNVFNSSINELDDGIIDVQELYTRSIKEFEEHRNLLKKVIINNPESIFVAAAGNGISLMGGLSTQGVPLDDYELFPATMDARNLIKVSSLDDTSVNVQKRTDYRLMDYANYSVKSVDVAAPVEFTDEGRPLTGTSFAAPYVSRLSKKIVSQFGFEPSKVKSILLRSAFIENLDRTISLTREYNDNQRDSIIHRIVSEKIKRKRDAMIEEIADVMLVKSGGPLVSQVALKCAENYAQAGGVISISEACLMAHESELEADTKRQTQLEKFWSLRNIP